MTGSGWAEWVALLGAAIGFAIGLHQYRTAQAWKRAEFVAAEVAAFFADPQIATALLLIDYNVIRLGVDGRRVLKGGYVFNDAVLMRALAIHTRFENEIERFSDDEMLARMAFDTLLTGLERFDHYVQTDLISVDDLRVYLQYWISKMADRSARWKEPAFYDRLDEFIDEYQYRGTRHLLDLFGVHGKVESRVRQAA